MSRIDAAVGNIDTLNCTRLNVFNNVSLYRWDPQIHSPNIEHLGIGDVARLRSTAVQPGVQGGVATTNYILGTDTDTVRYDVYFGTGVLVGLTIFEGGFPNGDSVMFTLPELKDTAVTVTLGLTTITAEYDDKTEVIDITTRAGQAARMGVGMDGDNTRTGFSVRIAKLNSVVMGVGADGEVTIDTSNVGHANPLNIVASEMKVNNVSLVGQGDMDHPAVPVLPTWSAPHLSGADPQVGSIVWDPDSGCVRVYVGGGNWVYLVPVGMPPQVGAV